MKIYCLSGLGVDERAFQKLAFKEIELVYIQWIRPHKKESLVSYSRRLFESINLPEDYNLMGVSFGGMIAQEFSKIRKPQKLFLISSLRNRTQLPLIFRIAGKIRLDSIIPMTFFKSANFGTYYFFGVKNTEDKNLLKEILADTNSKFLRWALRAILQWKPPKNVIGISIHGSKDRILKSLSSQHFLQDAGHFMIVTHASEVEPIISKNI